MKLEFVEEMVSVGGIHVAVAVCKLANGSLIFVSDGDHRVGTIGFGVPTPFGDLSQTATSCLVGTRFQAAVRAIAEIAADKLGGIAVVNLFLSRDNEAFLSSVLAAVRQVILKIGEQSAYE
ncbi:MAG: hypothetical protein ACFFDP_09620 [Promethearchaeota archaeon]